MKQADRFNKGKNRLELIDAWVMERVGEVLTFGAEKYDPQNWRKGLSMIETLGSLKRHLSAFEKGSQDYDNETGLHHLSHVIVNAMMALYNAKYNPQVDDRVKHSQKYYSVGYDIDDVLLDFVGGWKTHFELPDDWMAKSWHNKEFSEEKFKSLDADFWLNLKPKIDPLELYTPTVYITSRSHLAKEVTPEWLNKHGFPDVPVVYTNDKAATCNEYELDLFFDDRLKHYFSILNNTDTKPILINMPHNKSVNVANRVFKINDAIEFK